MRGMLWLCVTIFAVDCAFGFERIVPKPKEQMLFKEEICALAELNNVYTSDSAVYKTARAEIKRSIGVVLPGENNISTEAFFLILSSEQKDIPACMADYLGAVPDKEQGYFLMVSEKEIVLAAKDRRGLWNALWSLIQIIDQDGAELTCVELSDYPDILNRFFHVSLRGAAIYGFPDDKTTMGFYSDLLRRLAWYKYTHVCLSIKDNLELKRTPGYWTDEWTQAELTSLVRFGRSLGLSLCPEVKTLSNFVHKRNKAGQAKCGDLLEPVVDLSSVLSEEEHRNAKKMAAAKPTFKARDERVYKLLFSVLDEVVEVFDGPEYICIGMDEVTYIGASTPEEDKSELFAYAVNRLNRHVRRKGATTIMAADMLESHEQFPNYYESHGGPPYNTHRAIDLIDKNIVLWSWHYGWTVHDVYPDTYPQIEWETRKGFKVLGSPWFKRDNMVNMAKQVKRSNAFGLIGTAFGFVNAFKFSIGVMPENHKSYEKEKGRKQMGAFASTAEAAWSPEKAQDIIALYDDVSWEMQYFKKYVKQK